MCKVLQAVNAFILNPVKYELNDIERALELHQGRNKACV